MPLLATSNLPTIHTCYNVDKKGYQRMTQSRKWFKQLIVAINKTVCSPFRRAWRKQYLCLKEIVWHTQALANPFNFPGFIR